MTQFRNLLIAALIAIVVGGCASIPLSTALQLSTLTPQSLAQIDPAQVRVKLSVSSGYEVDIPGSRLKLSLSDSTGTSRTAEMPLSLLLKSTGKRSGGLFSSDVSVNTYDLALSPEGTRKLQALQQSLLLTRNGKFEFTVSAPFSKTPPRADYVTFWADLKLSNKDAYIPLINGAKIKFEHEAGS